MVGYGIGYIGQGSSYNFMGAYFVVFLTNSVGLNAGVAGTISSIAMLVEVIAGMIVGNLSDNCTSPMGKRRPFLLTAAIVLPIVMVLITRTIDGSNTTKLVYYLILSVLFRLAFATFEIPNNAFGAEIATGYDERTKLRTLSRVFSIFGNALGYVMPLWILDLFPKNPSMGWQVNGIIIAVVCFISWMTAVIITKGKSAPAEPKEKKSNVLREIAVNYIELSKLKTMRILIVYKAAFASAFGLFNIGTVYYLKYCLGLDNRYSSYMYVLTITIFVIMTPIANKIALVFGKANQQISVMVFSATIGYLVFFLAPDSVIGAALYVIGFSAMQSSFWQLSSSIFYDVVEVDEFVNGKRREGDIMSLVSVLGTLITAIIVQIFGFVLGQAGFVSGAETQPQSVLDFLNISYILIPSVCFTIGFVALNIFPINKKSFNTLLDALHAKKSGQDTSPYMEELREVIRVKS